MKEYEIEKNSAVDEKVQSEESKTEDKEQNLEIL